MSKNFSFMLCRDDQYVSTELRQGDIIERNEALAEAIRQAHAYYADADCYDFFLVLTPTCDLVLRNGQCNARYITLAAVRPLDVLVERQLKKYKQSTTFPGIYLDRAKRIDAERFVSRIIHNTEEGYLFLPGELFFDKIDRCAFLLLSIALRSSHYEVCANAKYLQLDDVFAARVGDLTSNLYGGVATAAIEEQADVDHKQVIEDYVKRVLDRPGSYWLTKEQIRRLKQEVGVWKSANDGKEVTDDVVHDIASNMPGHMDLALERIATVIADNLLVENEAKDEFLQGIKIKLSSDPILKRFF